MESAINYQPKFGRVIIKREVKEKIGSIIIPDAKKHASFDGVIVALGETAGWVETYHGNERIPVQTLMVGDKVIFGRYSGSWLDATYGNDGKENDDGTLYICQDADILAVVKDK